jgi:hypothetical protein
LVEAWLKALEGGGAVCFSSHSQIPGIPINCGQASRCIGTKARQYERRKPFHSEQRHGNIEMETFALLLLRKFELYSSEGHFNAEANTLSADWID